MVLVHSMEGLSSGNGNVGVDVVIWDRRWGYFLLFLTDFSVSLKGLLSDGYGGPSL